MGVAITATISTVLASLLFTTMRSGRVMLQTTDQYESLRVAAASIMEDARFATLAGCDWDNLRLSYSATDYVHYKFAAWDGAQEVPDPQHLHRWIVRGGVVERDDIVGWNLVAADPWAGIDGTEFDCNASTTYRKAWARLVKPPAGTTPGAVLEVTALLR